jgi:hypothetical protein
MRKEFCASEKGAAAMPENSSGQGFVYLTTHQMMLKVKVREIQDRIRIGGCTTPKEERKNYPRPH